MFFKLLLMNDIWEINMYLNPEAKNLVGLNQYITFTSFMVILSYCNMLGHLHSDRRNRSSRNSISRNPMLRSFFLYHPHSPSNLPCLCISFLVILCSPSWSYALYLACSLPFQFLCTSALFFPLVPSFYSTRMHEYSSDQQLFECTGIYWKVVNPWRGANWEVIY